MTSAADVEKAERLGRARARIFAVQAVLFLGWQTLFFSGGTQDRVRAVSQVKISAWMVMAILLLFLLASGGMLIRGRKVRGLLNDELTRSHRTRAYVWAFWAAMISALGLYAVDMFDPVTAREAIHLIVSAALGVGLLTFSRLERRSRSET
ncbi:MAG: hypothetical protein JOZ90_02755 [Alphaproteobacteria bacterium]|nr:hypothetical protein [Alphaproteobacteria bacterium]MBV9370639.1 hypothetical protein [Alphaproteobacteria bacterium]MBV9899997.1 hypothetical protein [Alphaproteobacteria bacterium]